MSIELRGYQREAISAVHDALSRGVTRPAVVLPTGAGKTVIFAHPTFREPLLDQGQRMLVLVHRDELALQAMAKFRVMSPDVRIGRVQAQYDEIDADIIVASVQTLARQARRERVKNVGLLVVDEAHHATARTYVETLRHFGAFDDRKIPIVGFSATLERGDGGKLGDIWQEVVTRVDVIDGIRQGWLVDVRGKRVAIEGLDLTDVKRSRGDYSSGDLGDHLEAADAPEQVAQAYAELAKDRQGIAFWPTVDVAISGALALNESGIPCEVVTGETSPEDRASTYDRYRRGDTQVISSVMVLTEGFDMPQASCAVIARPTRSAPLYVQMAGRILRPHHLPVPGFGVKSDALIIDAVGASADHRLATLADLSTTLKVAPSPDSSLLDAADAELSADELRAAISLGGIDPVTGRRVIRDVNLFGERSSLWLQTPRGTWFIPAGDWIVFLWPADTPGLWTIGATKTRGTIRQAIMLGSELTLDWAMQQAEQHARKASDAHGKGRLDSRKAYWRSGSPSDKQLAYARSLGVHVPASATKADVADAISMSLAARVLGG